METPEHYVTFDSIFSYLTGNFEEDIELHKTIYKVGVILSYVEFSCLTLKPLLQATLVAMSRYMEINPRAADGTQKAKPGQQNPQTPQDIEKRFQETTGFHRQHGMEL